jgi:iron complex outermembrane recepter protein
MSCVRSAVLLLIAMPCVLYAADPTNGSQSRQLKSLSLEQLGDVEVTTQSKEPKQVWNTPAAIYVLSNDDIRRSGVTNVADALRLIPGVNVARVNGSRNWAIGIRGFGDQFSKYVLVLIDGRSVYTPLFGGVLWTVDTVILEDIDRIEIIRGPGGTIWGADAVNGIINIITKASQDTQGTLLSAGGGNVDQDTEDARYGASQRGWQCRASAFGFVRSPEFHVQGQPNYDWSRLGQVGFRTDRKEGTNEVTVQGDAYWGKFGDAQVLSTYTPPAAFISYQSTNVSGGNLRGRWRRAFENHSDLYLQAFWSHDHRIGSNFGEDRDTFDVDFLHRLPATEQQQFTYGAGIRLSPSKVKQTDITDTFLPLKKTDSIYSAFFQDDLQLIPGKLSFIIGSKLEHNSYTGFEFQPNGRLLFTPTAKLSAWASVSRAIRTPDRVDEDIQVDVFALGSPIIYGRVVGNRNLRAERLIAYEAGIRSLLHPKLYLDLSAFHNAYHDLIAQGPPSVTSAPVPPFPPSSFLVTFQYINGIRGKTDGFEIAPDWQASSWWRMRAGYSFLNIDLSDQHGFTDTLTLRTLRGSSPNQQAFLQSQIDLRHRFEFDQSFRYVGSLPAQGIKAYTTADARLGWNPSKNASISVTGQNWFQPHHAEFGIDPAPTVLIKRGIYARVVWSR